MPDRRSALAMAGSLLSGLAQGRDVKVLPAERRRFESASGEFVLEVLGAPGWRPPSARAEFFAVEAQQRSRLWSRDLPQRYGPASVIVSDAGCVLMIDEGVRTPSPYALLLLSREGEVRATWSMTDIASALGVTASAMVRQATIGAWMSGPPRLAADSGSVVFESAGSRLAIDLRSGSIRRALATE